MKQIIRRLRTVGLRQIITILATVTFLVIPAFNHSASLQAQAASADVESGATVAILLSGFKKRLKTWVIGLTDPLVILDWRTLNSLGKSH